MIGGVIRVKRVCRVLRVMRGMWVLRVMRDVRVMMCVYVCRCVSMVPRAVRELAKRHAVVIALSPLP